MTTDAHQERRPPRERFSGTEHVFDLREIATGLRDEDEPVRDGHRQMTVYHKASVSLIVFDFEAGGRLMAHQADAEVMIQAIDGVLEVWTPTRTYRLPAGSLLVLDPGVTHDVFAAEESRMLLTVARSTGRDAEGS
jgi:quercetin dioxygenase-like cupin family protein